MSIQFVYQEPSIKPLEELRPGDQFQILGSDDAVYVLTQTERQHRLFDSSIRVQALRIDDGHLIWLPSDADVRPLPNPEEERFQPIRAEQLSPGDVFVLESVGDYEDASVYLALYSQSSESSWEVANLDTASIECVADDTPVIRLKAQLIITGPPRRRRTGK